MPPIRTGSKPDELADNFEQFNRYADQIGETESDVAVAMLAVAFELSQLRYFVSKLVNSRGDNHGRH